ncbi:MAG: hypothetical protein ACRDSK_21445 [Actinophytocola sp.]|uniref:hypothetical protein n=1 Tax=Actinophytocola sp. TaxID=1872138 RepID=UPI003D6B48CE
MPHDKDLGTGTGVGTDGSLHSPKEEPVDHGADRSTEHGDGVGTDGSLVNPEKDLVDVPEPEYTDRDRRSDLR